MEVHFTEDGWKDYCFWHKHEKRVLKRINRLIEDIKIQPYSGVGKPEPLKHQLSGTWSRRIDLEHRLIYFMKEQDLWILSCRGHYTE